jgi:two-component system cell cycle sensor histidine kinase/response regulator CckA
MPAQRVLVVDDEQRLLDLIRRYLSRLGYEVECFANTEDAWECFRQNPTGFAAVLVDMTIQGRGGYDLTQRILESYPETPLVACSGYPVDLSKLREAGARRLGFLQKPFAPAMLARVVEDAINGFAPSPPPQDG